MHCEKAAGPGTQHDTPLLPSLPVWWKSADILHAALASCHVDTPCNFRGQRFVAGTRYRVAYAIPWFHASTGIMCGRTSRYVRVLGGSFPALVKKTKQAKPCMP